MYYVATSRNELISDTMRNLKHDMRLYEDDAVKTDSVNIHYLLSGVCTILMRGSIEIYT